MAFVNNLNAAQNNAETPRATTAADEIAATISAIHDRVGALGDRLYGLASRAVGSEPEGKSAGTQPKSVPNGALHGITMSLQDLAHRVEDLHGIAMRLERIA